MDAEIPLFVSVLFGGLLVFRQGIVLGNKIDKCFQPGEFGVVLPVVQPGFPDQGIALGIGENLGLEARSILAAALGQEGKAQALLDHFQAGIHGIGLDGGHRGLGKMGVPPVVQKVLHGWVRGVVDVGETGQLCQVQGSLAEGTDGVLPQKAFFFFPVPVPPDDAQLEFPFPKIPVQVLAEAAAQVNFHLGIDGLELAQQLGHMVFAEYVGAGDGYGACRPGLEGGKLRPDGLVVLFLLEAVGVEPLAFRGEGNAPGLAEHQGAVKFLFQVAQPVAQGRLGNKQALGGMGNILFFIQCLEQIDITAVHRNISFGERTNGKKSTNRNKYM